MAKSSLSDIKKSPIADLMKQEAEYKASWAKGKCTFGDMNINRHQSAPYRNEWPAGNKCEVCGTF